MFRGRHIIRLFTYLPFDYPEQRDASLRRYDREGEMAVTYHSIISTVKMQGRSVWEYLGKFFTKIFNSCGDFFQPVFR